ncbi:MULTISPECIES: asparagine synthase (glutamine-hydrolyzing) [unclassified Streptomyces]|uniref:asparagine synthase (glutamine-hydrolyzing) n=1 Tax=unclassified Streptomyces TaxID=2593676 RepID=UPI00093DD852|nr:asparagine synthase (glutamine-hydrolyzing) [Streptomyces sp. CB02058]OKI94009.1 asparagine synthase [Streptomyces sp. CB02058]
MCGLTGYVSVPGAPATEERHLDAMTATLVHRGPDSGGRFVDEGVGIGFRRLSIIDLAGGDQPIYNEDGSVVLACNGEIFNYRELRAELVAKGHTFRTECDVEVLVHLYEEEGTGFLDRINGQFAFAIYDRRRRRLFLARDHAGILPMYYARTPTAFVFGSEIKAVLEHPAVERAVDLTGLDQVLTFPGLVSPRTMFRGVRSLENGHYLTVEDGVVRDVTYWDLDFPVEGEEPPARSEGSYVEELRALLDQSVARRLRADVPVGYYLSGGLDSSLIAALVHAQRPAARPHSFSISFGQAGIDESGYQRLMARQVSSVHHETEFDPADAEAELSRMVRHAECPVKETYNTCSLALSASARRSGTRVILTGEGADELFGGYLGYRFDRAGNRAANRAGDLETQLEDEVRRQLWGDPGIFYERDYHAWREAKLDLFSDELADAHADFDTLAAPLVDPERLRGRSPLHQRSYLDFKLRLSDHLLSDHGDRMALANSIEARYPFLDIDVVRFAARLPARFKVTEKTEKYVLKEVAKGLVPDEIVRREKFGFRAPGSPELLRRNAEWVQDMLSPARIKRQGYFNPAVVERLAEQYRRPGYEVHPHLGDDLLLVVLTFGLLLDLFDLPDHA